MGSLVVTGASLQCTMGTTPATFTASATQESATSPVGVITDVGPSSIASFGLCQSPANPQVASATAAANGVLTPQPCMPVLSPWTPGSSRVTIQGTPGLDDSSQCMCSWAGTVSVTAAGQTSATVQ
jgi:Domain of unknown function (DUF4280)